MKMTLFDLDERIACLEAMMDGVEMVIDEDTGECLSLEEAIDALKMSRDEKIEGVACWVKNLVPLAKAARKEAARMTDRARVMENRAERLKKWLEMANMGENGKPVRFQTAKCDVLFRNNQPALRITNVELIPRKYVDVKSVETVCNERVKKALLDGERVPGAELTHTRSVMVR